MLTHEAEVEAPFRSVRHALRQSFELEGHAIIKRPMLLGSRSMSMRSDLTPFDRAAQAAIVLRLLHENCRLDAIRAVTALYMPIDAPARGIMIDKRDAMNALVRHVMSYPHLSGHMPEYIADVVAEWSGAPQQKTQPEWLQIMGCSSRTLERIRFGNKQRNRPGVMQLLDDLLDEAAYTLHDVFARRGLVGPRSDVA